MLAPRGRLLIRPRPLFSSETPLLSFCSLSSRSRRLCASSSETSRRPRDLPILQADHLLRCARLTGLAFGRAHEFPGDDLARLWNRCAWQHSGGLAGRQGFFGFFLFFFSFSQVPGCHSIVCLPFSCFPSRPWTFPGICLAKTGLCSPACRSPQQATAEH